MVDSLWLKVSYGFVVILLVGDVDIPETLTVGKLSATKITVKTVGWLQSFVTWVPLQGCSRHGDKVSHNMAISFPQGK